MPATTKKISDILFLARRSTAVNVCPGVTANQLCPIGTPLSPKRPNPRPTAAPKISKVAVALESILQRKNVSALWGDSLKVYFEVDGESYFLSDSVCYCNNEHYLHIALVLLGMGGGQEFDYTRNAAMSMVTNMDKATGIVQQMDLGFFCDCLYYDTKDVYERCSGVLEVRPFDSTIQAQVQQAVRTRSLTSLDQEPFHDFIGSTFQNISYTPPARVPSARNGTVTPASFLDSAWLDKCKNGGFQIGFEWPEAQKEHIHPLSSLDNFVPNKEYFKLTALAYNKLNHVVDRIATGKTGLDAIGGEYINAIICGKPGTGKTTTADALSAVLGLPIYTVPCSKNTEEDTFEGMTKVSEGSFLFKSTPFLEAYENGGIVVLEEFNLTDPAVMQGAIGQAVEYPFILMKDGYQEVRRHPLCVIIATMNTGTQGAREPNEAFSSRFPITLTMNDPSQDEFIEILAKKGYKKADCRRVYRAYKAINDYLKDTANNEELTLCVTMRHCLAALDLLSIEDIYTAVYDTMIGALAIRDIELAEDVFKSAVKPLPIS